MPDSTMSSEVEDHYGRALDEVYRARCVAALMVAEIDRCLALATFPKGRREPMGDMRELLMDLARGRTHQALRKRGITGSVTWQVLESLGVQPNLTRAMWENGR